MNILDNFARALVSVLATFARIMLRATGAVESGLRGLMKGGGLSADMQTVLTLFIVGVFLAATLRLLRGRLRSGLALLLILVLAHVLEGLVRGGGD